MFLVSFSRTDFWILLKVTVLGFDMVYLKTCHCMLNTLSIHFCMGISVSLCVRVSVQVG